ncbi:MgtC/SapB family protein [Pseudaminobacter sp. 19-2017]|uniref:Protein MgtC n=1 Tax=Pseudaminobacter soli (ex Zhang et al. 2022) TaxID=2831468 RepID=A0A942DW95_9HYPH|nr:MgtC/SapB family protein [Pseudaminobacter soli]MBS3647707.1 MgtC/SapB family protein [Pseudaminobacter soli]
MEAFAAEFSTRTYTEFPVIVARLLLAVVLGAAIGFEREWRRRPAGLRTHILVCLAAATFTILAIEIVHSPIFTTAVPKDYVRVDPLRIVEAVTAGVAFLAAGVVIFTRGEVHGLTTGAGMWLAGAIGVATGLGLWQISLLATFLALLVLGLMQTIESALGLSQVHRFPRESKDGKAGAERAVSNKPADSTHVEPHDARRD